MLFSIIVLPLIACFILCFVDRGNHKFIKNFGLTCSLIILNICCAILFFFDPTITHFQFVEVCYWFNILNINCIFGIDGLALMMIILTAFLIPICIMLC